MIRSRSQARAVVLLACLVVGATGSVSALASGQAPRAAAQIRTLGANPRLPEPMASPAAFRSPPMLARPLFRWWWSATPLASSELVREVDAMAGAGFGGAEIAFGTGTWAGDAQRQGLVAVLKEAKRLGLHMDMTFGASWPITTPATAPSTGLSEQELQYGYIPLAGEVPYSGPVPNPVDDPTNTKKATLVALTAARVAAEGDPAIPLDAGAPNTAISLTPPARSPVLDPASLVELTHLVSSAGTVSWTPPASGHWLLFGLWRRPSAQNVMNEFYAPSAQATVGYLDRYQIGSAGSSLLPGVGRQFFEDSLELNANLFWTPDMLTRFRSLRGYDLAKYLPLLFIQGEDNYPVPSVHPNPDFDLPNGLGERVRHDFYQTLQDLYETQHMAYFEQWARSHAMDYRTQAAYGAPLDNTRSARAVDTYGGIADDETLNAGDPIPLSDPQWEFAFDHYRSVVGGVHQAGGKEVNSELGAVFFRDQEIGLADYKAMMDKQWAAGMTRPIVHGFDYQNPGAAWPGADNFGGVVAMSWNQNTMPQFSMFRPLAGYWARGNMVLQAGRPRVDLAVLRDGYLTTAATYHGLITDEANNQVGPLAPGNPLRDNEGRPVLDNALAGVLPAWKPGPLIDTRSLEQAGYTLDFIDPLGLTDPRVGSAAALYPGGPAYRALIVDQSSISGAAAKAIAAAARRGLTVVFVGPLPRHGTSAADPGTEDAQVRAAIAATLKQPGVRRVPTPAGVLRALAELGLMPGAAWSRPVPVYSQHRSSPSADYFYLWNADKVAHSFTASLAATGPAYGLDLWTGNITPLGQYATRAGRTLVPVSLRPDQTMVISIAHGRPPRLHALAASGAGGSVVWRSGGLELHGFQSGRQVVWLSDGRRVAATIPPVPTPLTPQFWHLHVDAAGPGGTTPHDATLTRLQDWRSINGLQGESGVGRYTTTLVLPQTWRPAHTGALLELGQAAGAIQAYLNGRPVAPDVTPDRQFDVTSLLRPGANLLRVVLTTTLKNKLVSEVKAGHITSGTAVYTVQPATQPYGLLGPVRLDFYGRVALAAPRAGVRSRRPGLARRPAGARRLGFTG